MKETKEFNPGGYYLFESTASARSCYFESNEEIKIFKSLFNRYLGKYIDIHKMFISSEGYNILLRIKDKSILIKAYRLFCRKKRRNYDTKKEREIWRIISEQMRVFHSLYVKTVNKLRNRSGVLVKQSYKRYYFECEKEFTLYMEEMKKGKEIQNQKNKRYRVKSSWKRGVNWSNYRKGNWVKRLVDIGLRNDVVGKIIIHTFNSHSP